MTTTSKTDRDPWCDNIRLVLLALVVVGHLLEASIDRDPIIHGVYSAIYLFHMPAIIFLLGRFSRPSRTIPQMASILDQSLVPYLVFQVAFIATFTAVKGETYNASLFGIDALVRPQYGLWFLLAMGIWRTAISAVPRHGSILIVSVLIALAAGYSENIGRDFSAARAINFLPFFLAGYLYGERILKKLSEVAVWKGLALVMAAMLLSYAAFHQSDAKNLFQAALPYSRTGLAADFAWAGRALHLALATIAAGGFFVLVPRTEQKWTFRGRNSLYIYLFHLLPVRSLQLLMLAAAPIDWKLVFILPITFGLVWFFSQPGFVKIARPIAEPKILTRITHRYQNG